MIKAIAMVIADLLIRLWKPLGAIGAALAARQSGKLSERSDIREHTRETIIQRQTRRTRIEVERRSRPPVSRIERVRNSRWGRA